MTSRALLPLACLAFALAGCNPPAKSSPTSVPPKSGAVNVPAPSQEEVKERARQQRRQTLTPDAPGTNDWKPSPMSPTAFAESVDGAIRKMRAVTGEADVQGERSELGIYGAKCQFLLAEPGKMSLYYLAYGTEEGPDAVRRNRFVVNGGRAVSFTDQGVGSPAPVGTVLSAQGALERWADDIPRLLFAGYATGQNPYLALVREATRPGSGWTVAVEERTDTRDGKSRTTQRLILDRPADESRIEVIKDSQYHVPVGTRARIAPNTQRARYQAAWLRWKLDPGQNISAANFKLTR